MKIKPHTAIHLMAIFATAENIANSAQLHHTYGMWISGAALLCAVVLAGIYQAAGKE